MLGQIQSFVRGGRREGGLGVWKILDFMRPLGAFLDSR